MLGSSACVERNRNSTNQNEAIRSEGLVNGVRASLFGDTDCNSVVVKQSLVRPDEYLGKTVSVRMMDNTAVQVTTVCVHIETPYWTGAVTACCVKQPLYELIICNVEGVENPIAPGITMADSPTSMAVETRS
ncbi:hypothetical protein ACJMK2_015197 [Sinanodonta woodiana]|uniref:Uncharacterized protein n=1 Tax=Sinanodonta woodiana TaxID=1069815 RepID=A0ABD3V610_SINWO